MAGAIYQLKVRGPQDLFLTGKPVYSFIKQVYKRHVNFATQLIELQSTNTVDFGKTIEFNIPRKADYLHKVSFTFTLPALVSTSGTYAGWTNSIGHAIIDYVEISIGDQVITRHEGLYLEILNELTHTIINTDSNAKLLGKYPHLKSLESNALVESVYEVPLQFWFCTGIGSSLPLIQLQHHSVKITVKLNDFDKCIVYDGNTPPNRVSIKEGSVLAEYIYMDETERLKLKSASSTFLITQNQLNTENVKFNNSKVLLDFNHPCSELLFVLRAKDNEDNNDWFNFSKRNTSVFTSLVPLITHAELTLDGNKRVEKTDERRLRVHNNYRYHSNPTDKHIYSIPLSNEPEKWYPSGSMNFSSVDQAELYLHTQPNLSSPITAYIFARNFNIIYIEKGMIQLGFST